MGLTSRKPTEANLQENVVMDAAVAANMHLNNVSRSGSKKKKTRRAKGDRGVGRHEFLSLLAETENLFV